MKKYCMDIKSINIQRVIYLLLLFVIILMLNYLMYIISVPVAKNILFAISLILIAAYIFTAAILLPMMYKRTVYCICEDYLFISRGILVYSTKYISIKSIQYVTLTFIPVLDKMGCCFLVTGGFGVRSVLTFLSQNDGREIAEFVRNRIEKNIGDKDGSLL